MHRGFLAACAALCFVPAILSAADPVDLEKLGARPSLWPKQVALKEALVFKDASGKAAQLPGGTVGEVISVQAQGIGVDFNGVTLIVPEAKTDLAERLPQQAVVAADEAKKREAIRAAMPKPTPLPQKKQAAAAPLVGTAFVDSLEGKLVKQHEGQLALLPPQSLGKAKYLAFYFSASWCGPCRKFTPQLADFYSKLRSELTNFEIIFISRDKSKDAMAAYVAEANMPWPAVAFEALGTIPAVTDLMGNGIPCLVLTDREGKVLSDSYVNGEYVGPKKVATDLANLLLKEKQ